MCPNCLQPKGFDTFQSSPSGQQSTPPLRVSLQDSPASGLLSASYVSLPLAPACILAHTHQQAHQLSHKSPVIHPLSVGSELRNCSSPITSSRVLEPLSLKVHYPHYMLSICLTVSPCCHTEATSISCFIDIVTLQYCRSHTFLSQQSATPAVPVLSAVGLSIVPIDPLRLCVPS